MSTAIQPPRRSRIDYPDSDGKPMADNTLQFRWIVTIKEELEFLFRDRPDVFIGGDLLWYAVEGDPTKRMAPDVLVAFGRPKGERGSYKQWEEDGIAPHVVFEILSPGNRAGEMERKFQFYQDHGVEEYYIYDPDHGDLVGWQRVGQRLREIPVMAGFVSPKLGIRFEPGEGPDNLKIYAPSGELFLSPVQRRELERERAETAEQRAKTAEQRAETAEQRAETAEQRAARYAAKLRELGIEPE
jgi:Uma2 family endonuclease